MDSDDRNRTVAVALALLAHALLLWAAIQAGGRWFPPADSKPQLLYILPINPTPPPQTTTAPRRAPASNLPRAEVVAPNPAQPPLSEPDADEPAPSVDWQQELERAVQSLAAAEAADAANPLDSKPEVLKLPERRASRPKRGDSHVLPGGGVGVWMNDKGLYCEFRQPMLMNQFDAWAYRLPPTCWKRGTGQSTLDLDALRPDYLSRPLPLPKLPQELPDDPAL